MARNKKQQYNHKPKKFPNQFKVNDISSRLKDFPPMSTYSFTKKNNVPELNNILSFLPTSYVTKLSNNIHSVEFIYSGSTESPFILGIYVGRLDTYKGQETYDIDLFHIAPESGSTDDYFLNQFPHIADSNGARISVFLNPTIYNSSQDRENQLYNTYLTGSKTGFTFEEFEQQKPTLIDVFKKSFKI